MKLFSLKSAFRDGSEKYNHDQVLNIFIFDLRNENSNVNVMLLRDKSNQMKLMQFLSKLIMMMITVSRQLRHDYFKNIIIIQISHILLCNP